MAKIKTLRVTVKEGETCKTLSIDINVSSEGMFYFKFEERQEEVAKQLAKQINYNGKVIIGVTRFTCKDFDTAEDFIKEVIKKSYEAKITKEIVLLYRIKNNFYYSYDKEGNVCPPTGEVSGTHNLHNSGFDRSLEFYASAVYKETRVYAKDCGEDFRDEVYTTIEREDENFNAVKKLNSFADYSSLCDYGERKKYGTLELVFSEKTYDFLCLCKIELCRIADMLEQLNEPKNFLNTTHMSNLLGKQTKE